MLSMCVCVECASGERELEAGSCEEGKRAGERATGK